MKITSIIANINICILASLALSLSLRSNHERNWCNSLLFSRNEGRETSWEYLSMREKKVSIFFSSCAQLLRLIFRRFRIFPVHGTDFAGLNAHPAEIISVLFLCRQFPFAAAPRLKLS